MNPQTEYAIGRCLFDESSDALLVLQPIDLRVVDANAAAQRLTGLSRNALLEQSLTELVDGANPTDLAALISACRTTRSFASLDRFAVKVGNNGRRAVHVRASRIPAEPAPLCLLILHDVSGHQHAQAELAERAARLRLMVEQMPAILWSIDVNFIITSSTGAALTLLGQQPNDSVGRCFFDVLQTSDPDFPPIAACLRALQGESVDYELAWQGRDFTTRVEPLRNLDGAIVGCIGLSHDITERKRAEALLAAEARVLTRLGQGASLPDILSELVQAAEGLAQGMLASVLLVRNGKIYLGAAPSLPEAYNQAIEGLAIGPKVGSCGTAAFHRERVVVGDIATDPLWSDYRELALGYGLRACWSTPILAGEQVLGTFALYYREPRQPLAHELALIDRMTHLARIAIERKQYEQSLCDSERRFRELFDNSPDAIFVEDAEGHVLDVNPAGCRLHGLTRTELIGKNVLELVPETARDDVRHTFAQMMRGETNLATGLSLTQGGKAVPVELRSNCINYAGRPAVLLHVRDCTERRHLEEEIRQAHKMEAVGRLAGGIAHDFNNLLTVILGYTDLLRREVSPDDASWAMLEEIQKTARRADELTRQLLAFSRKTIMQPAVLNLNTVVADVEKLLHRLIGDDIELVAALAPDLHAIKSDPSLVEQMIVNLAVNARDAMPDGGRLTLMTANVTVDSHRAQGNFRAGRCVLLTVSDTGCGIDAAAQAHIFEPFYTTKEVGKGTGLGLATVYGAVQQCDGLIEVASTPGRGTTFRIYLPAVLDVAAAPPRQPAPSMLPRGTETILVVEDQPELRELMSRILRTQGYDVLEAGDGPAALCQAGIAPNPIDLLLTDVVMPKMSGRELAEHMLTLRPNLRVLYVSGFTSDALLRRGVLLANAAFLQKPFTPETLLMKVREVLGRTVTP